MRTLAIGLTVLILTATGAGAEPVNCQKQVIKNLLKFKKTYLKKIGKCAENQNLNKLDDDDECPDAATQLKLDATAAKIRLKIELSCPEPDRTTLGFPSSCAYENTATGIEGQCAALPVTNAGELADCLMCWKGAEIREFLATLYASQASELCGGAFDETSDACSELDCATPLPVQGDLGDSGENDCQKAIGKAGIKHLVSVEKALEKCGLLGNDRATCLGDPVVQLALEKSETKLDTQIKNKCGNRDPIPDPPFCCRTGAANACMVPIDRDDCVNNLGGEVRNGQVCNAGNCDPVGGGNQKITWWSTCPINDTCDGALDTLDELIACVDATADEIAHEMLCIQFPTGWGPCPGDAGSPSLAFID